MLDVKNVAQLTPLVHYSSTDLKKTSYLNEEIPTGGYAFAAGFGIHASPATIASFK